MLAVVVDGVALPEADARAMWERFSAWMDEHRGDLAGFAKQEGFASVHPGVANGKPVLLVSQSVAQKPYGPAADADSRPTPKDSSGGSTPHHPHSPPRRPRRKNAGKSGPTR